MRKFILLLALLLPLTASAGAVDYFEMQRVLSNIKQRVTFEGEGAAPYLWLSACISFGAAPQCYCRKADLLVYTVRLSPGGSTMFDSVMDFMNAPPASAGDIPTFYNVDPASEPWCDRN